MLRVRSMALVVALFAGVVVGRKRLMRWGATDDETELALPGDELLTVADVVATRAITIGTGADEVWPWIAQLGQGRGGFYTYDFLENLAGADIHSADTVVAEWQDIEAGDELRLAPEMSLTVALVEPGRALVVRGAIPMGATVPYDFTWAFVLRDEPGGSSRLVVRERYAYLRRWASLLVEPVELISFVMTQRMLRGIKQRAERAAVPVATGRTNRITPTTTGALQ